MPAGRKRLFDKEFALQNAMKVFWKKGYVGTSLSDLMDVMQINKPSMYAAFGNKEALFVAALNQYAVEFGAPHLVYLTSDKANLKTKIRDFLLSVTDMVCNPQLPGGCFIANSTYEAGGGCLPNVAVDAVTTINLSSTQQLVDLLQAEPQKQQSALSMKPAVLANYLMTLQYGLAAMARRGTSKQDLSVMIDDVVTSL
jgi:AcrR family transcriptional regulator